MRLIITVVVVAAPEVGSAGYRVSHSGYRYHQRESQANSLHALPSNPIHPNNKVTANGSDIEDRSRAERRSGSFKRLSTVKGVKSRTHARIFSVRAALITP